MYSVKEKKMLESKKARTHHLFFRDRR